MKKYARLLWNPKVRYYDYISQLKLLKNEYLISNKTASKNLIPQKQGNYIRR